MNKLFFISARVHILLIVEAVRDILDGTHLESQGADVCKLHIADAVVGKLAILHEVPCRQADGIGVADAYMVLLLSERAVGMVQPAVADLYGLTLRKLVGATIADIKKLYIPR